MNKEKILEIINNVMDEYELGSDKHKLYIKDNKLYFCSVMYDWFKCELENDTPEELLKSITTLIMDWAFEINEYKEK